MSWGTLAVLLGALAVGALTLDRRTAWPGLVGDEAVYLMAAESLAWDLDLTYSRQDFERFVAHWGVKPEGLILQSGDHGASIHYGKPPSYALFLAPFVRLSPTRGPFLANALLLAFAAVLAARALRGSAGDAAPLYVAVLVFASLTFAHVFWAHADLFLLCLVAIAYALVLGTPRPVAREAQEIFADVGTEAARRVALRWAGGGILLAVVVLSRPLYAALLLPPLVAIPARRRALSLGSLLGGAVLALGIGLAANQGTYGTWTSYGGERLGFYSYTGFPQVEGPAADWRAEVARRGGTAGSWVSSERLATFRWRPRVTAWNLLYVLAGRDVGLLPYFLPLLLALSAFRADVVRWSLLAAVGLGLAGFLYLMPFNFYGGGAALGNRYFLPLYPALWFVAARPVSLRRMVPTVALAGAFLYPTWLAPRAYPWTANGGLRYVSPLAARFLPYETTQDHLKPSGRDDVVHNGLWLKPLTPAVRAVDGGGWLEVEGSVAATVLLGSPRPLASLNLDLAAGTPTTLAVEGGQIGRLAFVPSGEARYEVRLEKPVAHHPMWWSEESYDLYRLTVRFAPGTTAQAGRFRFRWMP